MPSILLPVPHIQQRNSGECLAACAAMVLSYLGISTSYDQLMKRLQVRTLIGAPAHNVRYLETLGVEVIYQQGTFADLHSHLTAGRPCISFVESSELPYWDNTETDHAVVVVGLDDQSIYLNDPDFPNAPIRVSRGDFDLAWLEWDEFYATFIRHP